MPKFIVSGTIPFSIEIEAESKEEALDAELSAEDLTYECSNAIAENNYSIATIATPDGEIAIGKIDDNTTKYSKTTIAKITNDLSQEGLKLRENQLQNYRKMHDLMASAPTEITLDNLHFDVGIIKNMQKIQNDIISTNWQLYEIGIIVGLFGGYDN